jgi:hypothetical protein
VVDISQTGFLKGWTNRNANLKAFLAKNIT